jgi:hypothetical protein
LLPAFSAARCACRVRWANGIEDVVDAKEGQKVGFG